MRNRTALMVLASSLLLDLSPLAADSMIQRGIDVFTTVGDGKTFYDFSQNPIPAGFFCERSKVFTDRVEFQGLPLATRTPGELSWSFRSGVRARKSSAVVVDTDGNLTPDTLLPGISNFAAGQSPDLITANQCPPCAPMVCHSAEGEMHCYYDVPPGCAGIMNCPDM